MSTQVSTLVSAVRVALDMNNSSAALAAISDIDTLTIDEMIEKSLPQAARIVEMGAPVFLLSDSKRQTVDDDDIVWDQGAEGTGMLKLPNDFMRLASFQMTDWSRSVCDAIFEDDPLYLRQKSRYAGVRGNQQKPVVAVVERQDGIWLEFYSSEQTESVDHLDYIPLPVITGSGSSRVIDICTRLQDAIVDYAAYMVAGTTGDQNLANVLLNKSKELMR